MIFSPLSPLTLFKNSCAPTKHIYTLFYVSYTYKTSQEFTDSLEFWFLLFSILFVLIEPITNRLPYYLVNLHTP